MAVAVAVLGLRTARMFLSTLYPHPVLLGRWGGGLGMVRKHGGCRSETPRSWLGRGIAWGIGVGGGAGVELVELVDFDIGREGLCWSSK